ncbi:hypothetical protein BX616_003825 [Lobosporangium transversale]|nr:hypothetical protein BX616_003825 [Lobosporangium transversale]
MHGMTISQSLVLVLPVSLKDTPHYSASLEWRCKSGRSFVDLLPNLERDKLRRPARYGRCFYPTPTKSLPTLSEAEVPSQALLSQLKESLIQADVNYQNCLGEKMKTTVHYNEAIINPALPTEDAEAARLKFEQMNKDLTDKLDRAEVHYQMIKDLTDIQEAMNKTRQLVVAPNEERSLPEAETQDQLKNTIESFPKQRNHPGRVENHHPYQLGIRAQAADDKP